LSRLLYVVRHATPDVRPEVADTEWQLSTRGIEEARRLARTARGWGLRALYASPEAKARATASAIGIATGLPVTELHDLGELRLPGWIDERDDFEALVRDVLGAPGEAARGAETATDAAARLASAVDRIGRGLFPAAAVTHGRVLTAYLATVSTLADPFAFWRSLPMPGWAAIELDAPERGLIAPFASLTDSR